MVRVHPRLFAAALAVVWSLGQSADGPLSEFAAAQAPVAAAAQAEPENPFPRAFPAPSLEGGIEWLNTSGEITLKDLRGKVVLLDFWTYCCINCLHVLPDLKYLEQKYANELVVIGVHSAKFENEKETGNIREAIVRYEIEHPVLNDANLTIWRKFNVSSWPTLVLIDPEGNYCGFVAGEGNREILDQVIAKVIEYHRAKKTLDETPVQFRLEREDQPPTPLRYPGKVLADASGQRLFISDSNHNRIVVAGLDGTLIDVIGNGQIGHVDGDYRTAQFDHPQGLELIGNTLYVADTENHLLRTVDLEKKVVSTLAGTGQQARGREPGGRLKTTPLNSPWALEHVGDTLFIAMAGPHQLWQHQLGTDRIGVFSGTGREDITDGPHASAAYAQSSGMDSDGKFLYVACSEGSSIRKVSVDPKGRVETIAGAHDLPRGRSLFEFGDVDGRAERARLQHPLCVALSGKTLFVADTYNHKIKTINLDTRNVDTWLGDGRRGSDLAPVRLSEPSGLSLLGDRLFIADTNNHRILVADIGTKAVSEIPIAGLSPPEPPKLTTRFAPPQTFETLAAQQVASGKSLPFAISVKLPQGFKLNPETPVTWRVHAEGSQSLVADEMLGEKQEGKIAADGSLAVDVPLQTATGEATLLLTVTYGYCRDGNGGVCKLGLSSWKIPVTLSADAPRKAVTLSSAAE